jgi:hypothetical protein
MSKCRLKNHSNGKAYDLTQENMNGMVSDIEKLKLENARYRDALELIATPVRSDGTYNRDRKACEELAREALKGGE